MAPRFLCLLAALGQAKAASTYDVNHYGAAGCSGEVTSTSQYSFERFAEQILAAQVGAAVQLECSSGCCTGTHGDQSHSFKETFECGLIEQYVNNDCSGTPASVGQVESGANTCSFAMADGSSARTMACHCGTVSDCGIEPDDSSGLTTAPNSVHIAIGFATYFVGIAA